MSTILVWLLIVQVAPGSSHATTYVIDNITTQAECERVQRVILDSRVYLTTARCIQVQKAKGQP